MIKPEQTFSTGNTGTHSFTALSQYWHVLCPVPPIYGRSFEKFPSKYSARRVTQVEVHSCLKGRLRPLPGMCYAYCNNSIPPLSPMYSSFQTFQTSLHFLRICISGDSTLRVIHTCFIGGHRCRSDLSRINGGFRGMGSKYGLSLQEAG